MGCPVEPLFRDLYPLLGNKQAQDDMRRQKGDGKTGCPLLRHMPSACNGCENNPHENQTIIARRRRIERHIPLINEAYRLLNISELGLIRSLDELTPEGCLALSILRDDKDVQRMKDQAQLIADRLAEHFAGKKR